MRNIKSTVSHHRYIREKDVHIKELKFFRTDFFAEEQLFCLRMILCKAIDRNCNLSKTV